MSKAYFIIIFGLSISSLNVLADCPDSGAVLCQNTANPRERITLTTAQFGTCWNWSTFNCGFCSNAKAEKDSLCRKKFGDSFEARAPHFGN